MCYYDYHHGGVFNSPSGRPAESGEGSAQYDMVDGHYDEDEDVYTGI